MKLSQMFENAPEIETAGLCIDPRCTRANDMYFRMEGVVHDGYEFVDNVIEKDIKYIVHPRPVDDMKKGVVCIRVENVNHTLNRVASMFYGHPSRKMKAFGVTRTNRKNATTSIIRDVYSHLAPCGYIGTVSISYGEVTLSPSLATPDVVLIHKTMKDIVERGMQTVTLEVGSYGLELGRMQSVDSDVAVFNNLTYNHLDSHGTIEHCFEARKKLFTNLKREGVAVLSVDDAYVDQLADVTEASVAAYGIDNYVTYQAGNIWIEKTGSRFILVHGAECYEVSADLVALYDICNPLSAVTAMAESGTPIEQQPSYLHDVRQIEGRMECIDEGQPFNAIIDFAHAPDGMEKVFEYMKDITEDGRGIITVFGFAGKRNIGKRRVFSEIASRYYDSIILTEGDPWDEDPREIANEIKSGIGDTNSIFIADRYTAIWQAIESANVRDTVLILGKGDGVLMYRGLGCEPWMGGHNVARHCIHKYSFGLEDGEKQGCKVSIKKFSV